jgi:lysylphosphatidylglycerol synthetase-like protein (DUF2156 family)
MTLAALEFSWPESTPDERVGLEVLRRHADHSSAFLALNRSTLHYRAPGIDGLIAFRPAGNRHLVQLCGPFAGSQAKAPLLRAFLEWAHNQKRRVTAVQLTRADAMLYVENGFVANQLGTSYSIDLERFTLQGKSFLGLRRQIRLATRCGVEVHELLPQELEQADVQFELARVDAMWLRAKGRHVKELTFMVGERGGRGARYRRAFVARRRGVVVAYATHSPCFGSRPGWLCDLMRRRPDAPKGSVEIMLATVIAKLHDEGWRWLHLGLTPFVGLDDGYELNPGSSALVRRVMRAIGTHGSAVYPARTAESFKLKWRPHHAEPEYIAFEPRPNVGALWQLLRVTHVI